MTRATLNFEPKQKDLLSFINGNSALQSLLYDESLLPEMLKRRSKDWHRMLNIALHFRMALLHAAEKSKSNPHVETDNCGFDRHGSHSAQHYVCSCGWEEM